MYQRLLTIEYTYDAFIIVNVIECILIVSYNATNPSLSVIIKVLVKREILHASDVH